MNTISFEFTGSFDFTGTAGASAFTPGASFAVDDGHLAY